MSNRFKGPTTRQQNPSLNREIAKLLPKLQHSGQTDVAEHIKTFLKPKPTKNTIYVVWYTYYNAVDENMYVPQNYSLTILSDLSTQTTDLKRQIKNWMDINMKQWTYYSMSTMDVYRLNPVTNYSVLLKENGTFTPKFFGKDKNQATLKNSIWYSFSEQLNQFLLHRNKTLSVVDNGSGFSNNMRTKTHYIQTTFELPIPFTSYQRIGQNEFPVNNGKINLLDNFSIKF